MSHMAKRIWMTLSTGKLLPRGEKRYLTYPPDLSIKARTRIDPVDNVIHFLNQENFFCITNNTTFFLDIL